MSAIPKPRPYIGMPDKRKYKCCICKTTFRDYGNNPYPISNIGLKERCCDKCNEDVVIKARLYLMNNEITIEEFGNTWKAKEFFSVYDLR